MCCLQSEEGAFDVEQVIDDLKDLERELHEKSSAFDKTKEQLTVTLEVVISDQQHFCVNLEANNF